jgi:hypothetical protein
VAGVGETLRELPWSVANVEEESVIVRLDQKGFRALKELPRDRWPAR